jgi:hypothetical protein
MCGFGLHSSLALDKEKPQGFIPSISETPFLKSASMG